MDSVESKLLKCVWFKSQSLVVIDLMVDFTNWSIFGNERTNGQQFYFLRKFLARDEKSETTSVSCAQMTIIRRQESSSSFCNAWTFKQADLRASRRASQREILTAHIIAQFFPQTQKLAQSCKLTLITFSKSPAAHLLQGFQLQLKSRKFFLRADLTRKVSMFVYFSRFEALNEMFWCR